jgi:hypothetical protein
MRKFYPFILLIAIGTTGFSQSPVFKIASSYFRSSPFEQDFSSFLKQLIYDPSITGKIVEKKTDTTLFYFEGNYTNHNPFFFKPTRVTILLTEEIVPVDSSRTDTVYTYQLFAYDNATTDGIQEVKKEFEKIHKKYRKSFFKTDYIENPAGTTMNGATYNFFDPLFAVAPFAVTWTGPNTKKEMCLILTLRLQTRSNQAILPVPFYTL